MNFFKALLLTMVAMLFVLCLQAQKNKAIIDSLEKLVMVQRDTNLAKTYSELTWQYRNVNSAKAIDYGRKAIALSNKLSYLKGLAQAYNDLGIIYYDKENYDSAIVLYKAALKIREQQKDDMGIASLYNKIGIVYQKQADYSNALYNQQNALVYFEKVNYEKGISYALNNIGILNQNLQRYDVALSYHSQSIAIKQKLNDKQGLVQSYVNTGNIYKIQEEYEKAETAYEKGLGLARQIENNEYLSNCLNNLGDLYTRKKEYNKALASVKESYDIRVSINDNKGVVSCLTNWADVLINVGKYDSASLLLRNAETLARKASNTKSELLSIYLTFSKLYEQKQDASNSLEYYKKYTSVKDSVYHNDLSSKFAELETKYNTLEKEKTIGLQQAELNKNLYTLAEQKLQLSEANLMIAGNKLELKSQSEHILRQSLDSTQKEEKIQALKSKTKIDELELLNQKLAINKKNITIAVMAVVTGLLLMLGYSYYRRYRLKQQQKLQAEILRQQDLATQAILQAEENERKRIASDLHDGVGQMMSAAKMNLSAMENEMPFANNEQRAVYTKALNLIDESCKEVRTVSHNMMPNALLKSGLANAVREFVNQIDVRVIKTDLYTEGLNERLDANIETVLYRVVQECVNNVIKHAKASHLDISLIKDADGISATIEDNGRGFDTADSNKFEGIGLKNIQSRISYLKGTVEWSSSVGNGTLVAIHVPFKV